MDTEEMYRRGVADAEKGEPHPFYYQHYYQYRRGYDRTRRARGLPGAFQDPRRRRRALVLMLSLIFVAGIAAVLLWRGRTQQTTAAGDLTAAPALAATAAPTRTPIFPTPTLPPTPTPVALHPGGAARVVNIEGSILRGRKQPMLKAAATASFKQGEQVRVLEGPVEADGFTWWRVEGPSGSGWSAQQSADGVVWLQPVE